MDYCIRKLLGLTEKNFIADENWLEIVTENNEIIHKIKVVRQILLVRNHRQGFLYAKKRNPGYD